MAEIISFEPQPDARLRLALRRLDEALEGQRKAIQNWSQAMSALKATTGGIADGLENFRARMSSIKEDLETIGKISAATVAICDDFERGEVAQR